MIAAIRLILSRPIGVVVLSAATIVMGVLSFQNIPLRMLPDGFEERSLSVYVNLRRANPQEAERHIAIPIEEALGTISGIDSIRTRCTADMVRIHVTLKSDSDAPEMERLVRDRIQRVEPDLPDDVTRVVVRRFGTRDMPVMWFSCSGDIDRLELSDFMEDVVIPRLESIDGVARVNSRGLVKRSVRIWLDREEVLRRRLDLRELLRRLRSDNLTADLGELREGGRHAYLRATMEFETLDEIRAIPVTDDVTLGQIARVEVVPGLDQGWGRFNGNAVIAGAIYKTSDANTVQTCENIRNFFDELKATHPVAKDMRIAPWFDAGKRIQVSLETLYQNALYGGVLAVLVLFAFFRRLRMTLLVTAAIPLSLTIAVTVLYFTGASLNIITMLALTIAVGMLIDNAIVVVEAIVRRRERGETPREAATGGASEVALAVLTATLTTIVVFAPVVFLADDANNRLLMGSIGGPIAYALLASLAVALVLVPLGSIYLRKKLEGKKPAASVTDRNDRGAYGRVLGWALRNRFAVCILALPLVWSAGIPLETLGRKDAMGGGGGSLRIRTRWPRHYSMSDASRATKIYEDYLASRREELGLQGVYAHFEKMGGFIMTWKEPDAELKLDEIREKMIEGWPKVPGVWTSLESVNRESRTSVTLEGEDPLVLERTLDTIEERLKELESVKDVTRERNDGLQELRITVDRDVADRVDFSAAAIRGTVGWIVRGARLSDFYSDGRDVPLIIEMDPDQAQAAHDLGEVLIPTGRGALPLSALTRFGIHDAPGAIVRHDGRRVDSLEVVGHGDDVRAFHNEVSDTVAAVQLPPGVRQKIGGAWRDLEESFAELGDALMLGIVFVFLLTGVLFESLILPFAVLFAIPPAIMGSLWALHITGKPLDGLSILGLILLAGIVVNNGIVLVDRVQQQRRNGVTLNTAVLLAERDRVRPVVTTALTTIAGLLPMAILSVPEDGIPYDGLAVAVVGGLICSTLATLLLVPVVFTLLVGLAATCKSVFRVWLRTFLPRLRH